jgi:hypothetical protein
MFGRSDYSRSISLDIGEIERRLRSLESRLERIGGRTSATAAETADRIGDAIASAFGGMAERLRNRAGSMSEDAVRWRGEAAKLGNLALRRLAGEVEHRPLVMLAVALGVGFLAGLASHRR